MNRATAPVLASDELRRQVETLAGLGYEMLSEAIEPLEHGARGFDVGEGRIPFVLVVRGVAADRAVSLVRLGGKRGFTTMEPADLARFEPIEGVAVPEASAYLLTDVDTGRETLNVTPDDALATIAAEGRSPLTVDEGLALVTQFPDVLRTHNAFSLLGSRCGDRRVTAIWLSRGAPRLGWCWAGNPHTWLGSASCAARVV
jgi:hypothetical protein